MKKIFLLIDGPFRVILHIEPRRTLLDPDRVPLALVYVLFGKLRGDADHTAISFQAKIPHDTLNMSARSGDQSYLIKPLPFLDSMKIPKPWRWSKRVLAARCDNLNTVTLIGTGKQHGGQQEYLRDQNQHINHKGDFAKDS